MYHCQVHFYLIGNNCKAFETIENIAPLEHFTHKFSKSDKPDKILTNNADVIFANLQNTETELETLILNKNENTELILLTDKNQMSLLTDYLPKIKDIWTTPISDEEITFRFIRWQQSYKMSKDFWQTNHFLEATINSTPNLIWYKDKEGIHKKVNDSFCKTVNKTKKQVEGQKHAYIWDVEYDDPACMESELEVMNKKKTCVSEEIIKTGDGMKTLTTYKSPLYNVDGTVMGTVGIAIDITQERAFKEELEKKNLIMEKIFTSIDCGVLCHSIDGSNIISVNRAALKILGYNSQDELVEKGFDMIAASVMDEDKEKLTQSIKDLKKEGDCVSVEYRVKHSNGEILHVMGNIKLLKENGELFYQRFLLDCTAQKLQEKKYQNRQMELIQALAIDYNLVCFFDLDSGAGDILRNNGDFTFDNMSDKKLLFDTNIDMYISKFVYDPDKEMARQAFSREKLKKELSEKTTYNINYRVFKNNEIKYFQTKVVRTGIWDEKHIIVLGFHNVDEETREEMKKKNLLEDALLQANRANKAKSVFLSNMSHDIRTPMNAIMGFTSLAITHINNKEQVNEYLKKITSSGNHLLSLINDILDMSRIESGKIQLEETLCSMPDILHGLHNIIQADIRAKQLNLNIDTIDLFDEDIYCDKLRLNQVLLNLLSNSVKYTAAGGSISIRITEKTGAPTGYANYEFSIKDNGMGMSKEFVEHIFEPFEREKDFTVSRIQGTGLGMAITKNIVDMMNGTINVKSEKNVGTEFILSFTFRLCSEIKKPKFIPELKNRRALIVDDDFNTCDSVSYMLQQLGMRAEWTLSGKEAVLRTHQALTRGDDYSVYIIDWLIPDMNGVEVARRIRKETGEKVPIIIMTAYDWQDIESEAKEAGVTAFCGKPLFLSEISGCLHSLINNTDEETENTAHKEITKLKTGRILLAEDVELNQEIVTTILGDAGFSVEIAQNGQMAVDMLKESEPGYYQLVLMDIQMPLLNGYEATKIIRNFENKELASIPIIAMTANAFEEDKQAAINSGMNGHIAKPIDIKILFSIINKIFK